MKDSVWKTQGDKQRQGTTEPKGVAFICGPGDPERRWFHSYTQAVPGAQVKINKQQTLTST